MDELKYIHMYHARIALRRGKPFRRKHSLTELNIIWERKVLEVLMYNVGIGKEECSEEKRERNRVHHYTRLLTKSPGSDVHRCIPCASRSQT